MATRKIKFINGEYYHIYNRGVDKRNIISGKYDIMRILESLSLFNTEEGIGSIFEYSFKEDNKLGHRMSKLKLVEIVAFNILDNHYHIVLRQISDDGISKFIQKFANGYTKYFNEKNKRSGVLFQGPFKAEHIDSDEYLNYVVAYVNGNHFIHEVKPFSNSVSNWGMRSSLEQYISSKDSWENKYFECDLSMIKHRYKNRSNYLREVKEIAKDIRIKRKNDVNLDKGLEF